MHLLPHRKIVSIINNTPISEIKNVFMKDLQHIKAVYKFCVLYKTHVSICKQTPSYIFPDQLTVVH